MSTWGPGNLLIVETRNGAILWNIPANQQMVLTESYSPTAVRNFSRLRWDTDNGQLLVNLAVGGRAVYDFYTGEELPEAAHITDSVPGEGMADTVVGAREYECHDGWDFGSKPGAQEYNDTVPGVYANYDVSEGIVYLALGDNGPYTSYYHTESIQVIETGLDAPWFRFRGWSPTCRYIAGSLGIAGTNNSDTVVWDVVTNQRVGTFANAREVMHPIAWSPNGDIAMIQTRDGAYLWHLSTDIRLLIHDQVEMTPDGSTVQNFHSFAWDTVRNHFIGVPVGAGQAAIVYDVYSGQQIGVYASGGISAPVSFQLSADGGLIVVYHARDRVIAIWDREAGTICAVESR